MGTTKGEEESWDGNCKGVVIRGKIHRWKTCIACLVSFMVSLIGGIILVFWEMDYHPRNSQLWMVPFGLIMFATPVIVWFSAFVSDLFCPNKEQAGLPLFVTADNMVDGNSTGTGTSTSTGNHGG
ncbi:hypothetical protein Dimus_006695 [Dionaea muscipula]